jgi:hypothetical protein
MRPAALLFGLAFIACLSLGCSGDDEPVTATALAPVATSTTAPGPAQTAPAPAATATQAAVAPSPTVVVTAEAGAIGPEAIVDPFEVIQAMFSSCQSMQDTACLDRVVSEAELPGAAEAFWQQHEAFLVAFEEHGAVDFGGVSSPFYNMARPEPVFLNGGFGLLDAGEVVPAEWQKERSYGEVADAVAFVEYAGLVEATTDGSRQVFVLQIPLQDCRACEILAYLNLQVSFDSGALDGVDVLPLTEPSTTPVP